MHDSHEEGYRYLRPQACIDELLAALEKAAANLDMTADWLEDDTTITGCGGTIKGIRYDAKRARAIIKRTKE